MPRGYSASDKRRYMKCFSKVRLLNFADVPLSKYHINKEFAKSLEIAYDALKIIQQQVWCEHDKS